MAASLQRYSVFMDQIPVLYSQFPRFQVEKKNWRMARSRVEISSKLFQDMFIFRNSGRLGNCVVRLGKEKSIRLKLIDGKSMSYE